MDCNLITENRGSHSLMNKDFFSQYINAHIKMHSKDYPAIDLKATPSPRDCQYWQFSPTQNQSIFELKGTLENIQFSALDMLPLPFYHNVKFNGNIKYNFLDGLNGFHFENYMLKYI